MNVDQADMFRNYGCYCTPNGKGIVNIYFLFFMILLNSFFFETRNDYSSTYAFDTIMTTWSDLELQWGMASLVFSEIKK